MPIYTKPGLTPDQEEKIDQINSKLDLVIGDFGALAQLIGGIKSMNLENDPVFSGIYRLALDVYERTAKAMMEVAIDQAKK